MQIGHPPLNPTKLALVNETKEAPLFETRQESGFWVAKIHLPQLNANIAAPFQTAFAEAVVSHEGPVILDLSSVDFMDSSGIAAIVFCFKSLALRDDLLLCGLSDRVRKSLEITQIQHVLRIFPTEADARKSLQHLTQK